MILFRSDTPVENFLTTSQDVAFMSKLFIQMVNTLRQWGISHVLTGSVDRRQRGRVVRALDLKSGGLVFKSCSEH